MIFALIIPMKGWFVAVVCNAYTHGSVWKKAVAFDSGLVAPVSHWDLSFVRSKPQNTPFSLICHLLPHIHAISAFFCVVMERSMNTCASSRYWIYLLVSTGHNNCSPESVWLSGSLKKWLQRRRHISLCLCTHSSLYLK